jgi:lysophospholipase L1-like esterase
MKSAAALIIAILLAWAAPAAAGGAALVSLGDSFSSGEGAGGYDSDAGACHRTSLAWPRVLGVNPAHHFACSGARTDHIDQGGQKRSGTNAVRQLDRLGAVAQAEPVDTVLLTAGGNDLRFKHKLLTCRFFPSACMNRPAKLAKELADVGERLTTLYEAIRATPGIGRLVVVGYPEIAPSSHERATGCGWLQRAKVRSRIARFAGQLDQTLRRAAAKAGAIYVSVRHALDGHELCTKDSWMFPVVRRRHILSQQQGHPTADGQRAIAAAIRRALAL